MGCSLSYLESGNGIQPFGRSKEGNQKQDEFIIQVADMGKILPGRMLILDNRRFLVLPSQSNCWKVNCLVMPEVLLPVHPPGAGRLGEKSGWWVTLSGKNMPEPWAFPSLFYPWMLWTL